eukprot:2751404-Amphidinium_carterae.1
MHAATFRERARVLIVHLKKISPNASSLLLRMLGDLQGSKAVAPFMKVELLPHFSLCAVTSHGMQTETVESSNKSRKAEKNKTTDAETGTQEHANKTA